MKHDYVVTKRLGLWKKSRAFKGNINRRGQGQRREIIQWNDFCLACNYTTFDPSTLNMVSWLRGVIPDHRTWTNSWATQGVNPKRKASKQKKLSKEIYEHLEVMDNLNQNKNCQSLKTIWKDQLWGQSHTTACKFLFANCWPGLQLETPYGPWVLMGMTPNQKLRTGGKWK